MVGHKRVRRADVAAAAGVSGATVSYVVNGRDAEMRIAAATAERVRRVAAELGYLPHGAARELRRGRTDRVAVVLWLGHQPVWAQSLVALHQEARRRGFQLLLAFRDRDEPLADVLLPSLSQCDGALVLAGAISEAEVAGCRGLDKPVVLVNHWPLEGFASVVAPTAQLLDLTTTHLLEQGWENLLLTSRLPHFVSGFEQALARAGLAMDPSQVVASNFSHRAGVELAEQLGEAVRGRGIVAAADTLAISLMATLAAQGLRAGRDYGLTGLHNHDAGKWLQVPLTTAFVRYDAIAAAACDLLVATQPAADITLPGILEVRQSSLRPVHGA